MSDVVNHPAHYNYGKIEIIEIIDQIIPTYPDPRVGYCIGQVVKYISRAPLKGSMETDLKKAQWYLNRAVGHLSKPLAE